MAFTIWAISLWPIHEDVRADVITALNDAGKSCPANERWEATVYEGPDLGGTKLTLEGSRQKEMIWTGWSVEGERDGKFIYSRVSISAHYADRQAWIDAEFRDAVREMLTAP